MNILAKTAELYATAISCRNALVDVTRLLGNISSDEVHSIAVAAQHTTDNGNLESLLNALGEELTEIQSAISDHRDFLERTFGEPSDKRLKDGPLPWRALSSKEHRPNVSAARNVTYKDEAVNAVARELGESSR